MSAAAPSLPDTAFLLVAVKASALSAAAATSFALLFLTLPTADAGSSASSSSPSASSSAEARGRFRVGIRVRVGVKIRARVRYGFARRQIALHFGDQTATAAAGLYPAEPIVQIAATALAATLLVWRRDVRTRRGLCTSSSVGACVLGMLAWVLSVATSDGVPVKVSRTNRSRPYQLLGTCCSCCSWRSAAPLLPRPQALRVTTSSWAGRCRRPKPSPSRSCVAGNSTCPTHCRDWHSGPF